MSGICLWTDALSALVSSRRRPLNELHSPNPSPVSRPARTRCNSPRTPNNSVAAHCQQRAKALLAAAACSQNSDRHDQQHCAGLGFQADLSQLQPHLKQQWHPRKNHGFGRTKINPFSFHNAVWRCPDCHHEWEEAVISRACNQAGCQQCAGKMTCADSKQPFMSQWNYTANAQEGMQPEQLSITSHQRVWWVCDKCPQLWPHEFQASPYERWQKPFLCCPQCQGQKACICNDAPRASASQQSL